MKPLVSVIITAFNRRDIIGRAIESARRQTWRPIEIVVVDDRSTDDTADVVERLAGEDLRLVRNAVNRGIGGAKNVGLEHARGEYIAFLDSDDEWLPEKTERQVRLIETGPGLQLAFCGFFVTRESGLEVVRVPQKGASWLQATMTGVTVSLGSTLLAHRDVFSRVGMFNEGIRRMQDRDWILRYLDLYDDLLMEPEPLARVYNTGFPTANTVREASAALLKANYERIARRGASALRTFEASLRFEVAVAHYREGHVLAATREAMGALVTAPALWPHAVERVIAKLKNRDLG